jgi:bifunctional non-homologous end joining protein LigD
MHWDFRLELDGVLKSWAVPKGPSLIAGEKRMAVETEDHPLEYADFEGVIPKGEYGGGTVLVWDRGFWTPLGDPRKGLARGKLDFELYGEKLRGRWHLVRMRAKPAERGLSWLLIKGRDAHARSASAGSVATTEPHSVLSGRDIGAVAKAADRVWSSRDEARAERPRRRSAPRSPLPDRAEVQLATLVEAPPDGPGWLHEIKLDGYRLLCFLDRDDVRLVSRNGHDWTRRFPAIADALRALPVESALLDGEAVVFDAQGRTSFQDLQGAVGREPGARAVSLALFDCLHLDGQDLRDRPLVERKQALRGLLVQQPATATLRLSDHVIGQGAEFFAAACRNDLEGIVSKRIDSPYRAGRSRSWLKIKCSRRQEFAIVGFTEPRGSRIGLGALLLGARDAAGALRYCGKVGTGFDAAGLDRLRTTLARLEQARPAVAEAPRMKGVHWVKPELVAEVSFSEWTRDGRVRQPVFQGLREDKRAADVRIEKPQGAVRPALPRSGRSEVAGVRLSHPERVYFPDLGITKLELAEYYEALAERVLPGLVHRPLSLYRCPQGIEGACFYQKHANDSVPDQVARVRVEKGKEPYAMVTDLASLISLVQIGALELHIWGARADRLDRPDLVTFDLDPDPSVPWRNVIETARALRTLLGDLGLAAFPRATGGKGVHVVAPLVRRSSWEDVRGFSRSVALELVRLAPEHFTANMSKARRKGKIFIDWVRNTFEATAIASWSVRARAGAPVAVPLRWEELESLDAPLRENPREVLRRLAQPDPWAEFESSRRPLSRAMQERFSEG